MPLVTMRELLNDAKNREYAVGGFNVFNFETLGAVIEVAEELKTPLVMGIPERLFKFVDVDLLSAAMVRAANMTSIPVALHLDHGHTYDGVMRAIKWGFTSVMFDGSTLSYEENVKITKEITKMAHALGITVEGELGYAICLTDNKSSKKKSIKLEQAADFVQKTKVDALAVGAGGCNAVDQLDFLLLGELNQAINIPLVMHGGSKLSKEDYRNAIKYGVSKINIATDMSLVVAAILKAELVKNPSANYIQLMTVIKKGVKEAVRTYMLNFDCISKAI